MPTYFVDFEVLHEEAGTPVLASTSVDIEREPVTVEEFQEISKSLFYAIKDQNPNDPPPYAVRVLRVAEDSEELRQLVDILNKNSIKVDDDDPFVI